jgi:predicted DNA-binding transcriptional regulator AlpA
MARARKLQRFLTMKDLPAFTGFRPSGIRRLIRLGQFPPPIKAGDRRSVWSESALVAWQSARITAGNIVPVRFHPRFGARTVVFGPPPKQRRPARKPARRARTRGR